MLIDGLEELPDDEGHRLDTLDLLLGPQELPLEVLLLILDVLLLQLEELEVPLEFLVLDEQVLFAEDALSQARLLCELVRRGGLCALGGGMRWSICVDVSS